MTSASELFYNRRYRFGRTSTSDYDSSSSSSSSDNINNNNRHLHLHINSRRHHHNHRHHHHHHHHHDFTDADSLRRSTPSRRLFRPFNSTENELVRLDRRFNRSLPNTASSTENVGSFRGPRVNGNDRLPTAVAHARARLLQRLSVAPPSRYRQRGSRISLDFDDLRHSNLRDEESTESSTTGFAEGFITDLTVQLERSQILHEGNKKPPGLNQEAMDRLHKEVFGNMDTVTEGLESRALQDCGICLENFLDGDKLIRLPCGHRFHSACLDPWVRKCGDCPFCRSGIFVN